MTLKQFLFFFQLSQERIEGFFIVGGLLIFIIGVGFWYFFKLRPEEKLEYNKWLIERKDLLSFNYKKEIKSILNQLSNQTHPCSKCSGLIFQVWDVNDSIIFRCNNCKKKQEFSVDTIHELKTIFDAYIFLYNEYLSTSNKYINNYFKNYFEWDLESVRKGNKLYSVFSFVALKEEMKIDDSRGNVNKSRRISQKVKDQVWRRDEGGCVECGSKESLEFDHIIPFSKGGANTYRNIQLLCQTCNRIKSDKLG